jgi:hypothetical protein
MWIIWCVLVGATALTYVYRGRLSRDEADQIFLDDSFSQEQAAQAVIATKVGKIEPILNTFKVLALAATIFVIGYYILDIVNRLK